MHQYQQQFLQQLLELATGNERGPYFKKGDRGMGSGHGMKGVHTVAKKDKVGGYNPEIHRDKSRSSQKLIPHCQHIGRCLCTNKQAQEIANDYGVTLPDQVGDKTELNSVMDPPVALTRFLNRKTDKEQFALVRTAVNRQQEDK